MMPSNHDWRSFLPLLLGAAFCAPAAAQTPSGLAQRGTTLQVVEPDANDLELRMTPVVRAVQRAADSVVSVYLQTPAQPGRRPITQGQGSGVILDDSGLVITNWHVVAQALEGEAVGIPIGIEVKLRDGRVLKAQIISSSPTRDLALLQLRLEGNEKVKPVDIGRSGDLMIGETLIAIGNPQGHANTVTSGVLSATGREIQVRDPVNGQPREYRDLLQTDAAINQGNSGGALLDITGKLVGINNAMAMGAENIGFAIPMDLVREVFEKELVRSSSFADAADSAWIGIDVADQDGAVVVTQVLAGSPAAGAGVQKGDVLAGVGEQPIRSGLDYQRHLVEAPVRQPFTMDLRRGKESLQVAPVPITATNGRILKLVGIGFEEVTSDIDPELLRKATLAVYRGTNLRRVPLLNRVLRVQYIQPGSPSEAIGLQVGDVVPSALLRDDRFGLRWRAVVSIGDFAAALRDHEGNNLKISVLRGDEDLEGTLEVRNPRAR
jgi:serine protease Do